MRNLNIIKGDVQIDNKGVVYLNGEILEVGDTLTIEILGGTEIKIPVSDILANTYTKRVGYTRISKDYGYSDELLEGLRFVHFVGGTFRTTIIINKSPLFIKQHGDACYISNLGYLARLLLSEFDGDKDKFKTMLFNHVVEMTESGTKTMEEINVILSNQYDEMQEEVEAEIAKEKKEKKDAKELAESKKVEEKSKSIVRNGGKKLPKKDEVKK